MSQRSLRCGVVEPVPLARAVGELEPGELEARARARTVVGIDAAAAARVSTAAASGLGGALGVHAHASRTSHASAAAWLQGYPTAPVSDGRSRPSSSCASGSGGRHTTRSTVAILAWITSHTGVNEAFWNARIDAWLCGVDQRPAAVCVGRAQLLGEVLEHDRRDGAAARGRRRRTRCGCSASYFIMLQRAAELGDLDRAARGPRDAGGADAEPREHRADRRGARTCARSARRARAARADRRACASSSLS